MFVHPGGGEYDIRSKEDFCAVVLTADRVRRAMHKKTDNLI